MKVGVAGFGVIGQRLADGVARQEDLELIGVADVAPTLAVRALPERRMPYAMYAAAPGAEETPESAGIPVAGDFDDLTAQIDIMLDSAPGGIGAKNKEKYEAAGVKAVFQGGGADTVADVFFHGYADYENGVGSDDLKLTSCNTTGLIRTIDALDRAVGMSGKDIMFAINIPQESVVIPETINGIRGGTRNADGSTRRCRPHQPVPRHVSVRSEQPIKEAAG